MGYDAHIVKVPNLLHNRAHTEAHAKALYREFREFALRHPASRLAPEQLTLNTAGSPTYRLPRQPRCEQIGHRLGRGQAVGFRYGIIK